MRTRAGTAEEILEFIGGDDKLAGVHYRDGRPTDWVLLACVDA